MLKRISADLNARKAVMYTQIGIAADLAYHFGLCQALTNEDLSPENRPGSRRC
jgi:hypothetical protein